MAGSSLCGIALYLDCGGGSGERGKTAASCHAHANSVARTGGSRAFTYTFPHRGLVDARSRMGNHVNPYPYGDCSMKAQEQLIQFVAQLLAVSEDARAEVMHSIPVLVLVTDQDEQVLSWRFETLEDAVGRVAALKFAQRSLQ